MLLKIVLASASLLILNGCGSDVPDSPLPTDTASISAASRSAHSAEVEKYSQLVQQVYLGYFGRPADKAGLVYFAQQCHRAGAPTTLSEFALAYSSNGGVRGIIDSFSTSAESQALYGGDNAAFLLAIYKYLFNREPDAAGRQFWLKQLDSGAITRGSAAVTIMSGAINEDAQIIANKTAAAEAFTQALSTDMRASAYSGLPANTLVRTMLGQVTHNTSPADYSVRIEATIQQLIGVPAQVSLSTSIEDGVKQSVTTFATSRGSAIAGVPVPAYAEKEVALALDANGDIRAAGLAGSGATALIDADSTAIAVVMLLVDRAKGISLEQLVGAIRRSTSFSGLKEQVSLSMARNQPLAESQALLRLASLVAADAVASAPVQGTNTVRSRVVIPPSVTSPFPFTIVYVPKTAGTITIDGDGLLTNTTALAWSVRSFNYSGAQLGDPSESKIFPASGSVFGRIVGSQIMMPIQDQGRTFKLRVALDPRAIRTNLDDIIKESAWELAGQVAGAARERFPASCAATLAANVSLVPKIGALAEEPNSDNFVAVFETAVIPALKNEASVGPLAKTCFGDARIGEFIAAKTKWLVRAVAAAEVATMGLVGVYEKMWTLSQAWGRREERVVCIDRTGQVTNCAVKFTVAQPNFRMFAGDYFVPVLRAFDQQGLETGIPANIIIENLNLGLIGDARQFAAAAPGMWPVRISDPITGATNDQIITAVGPVPERSTISANIDETVQLTLVDPAGVTPAPVRQEHLYRFTVNKPDAAKITLTGSMTVLVKLLKAEKVIVTADNNFAVHSVVFTIVPKAPCPLEALVEMPGPNGATHTVGDTSCVTPEIRDRYQVAFTRQGNGTINGVAYTMGLYRTDPTGIRAEGAVFQETSIIKYKTHYINPMVPKANNTVQGYYGTQQGVLRRSYTVRTHDDLGAETFRTETSCDSQHNSRLYLEYVRHTLTKRSNISEDQCPTIRKISTINEMTVEDNPYYEKTKHLHSALPTWAD